MNPKETFFKTGDLAFYKNYDGEIEAHLVLSKAILPSNFPQVLICLIYKP